MESAHAAYLDYYCRGPYAPFVKEHRLAGSAPVCLLDVRQPAGTYPDPPAPMFALSLIASSRGKIEFDMGCGRRSTRLQAGQLFLAPANTATDYVLDDASAFLVAAVPAASIRAALSEASPGFKDFGGLHAAPFRNQLIESLCRRMWEEGVDGGALGAIFGDYAVLVLAAALLRLSMQSFGQPPSVRTGLAPWRLRRVTDYVDQNLGRDPSLNDLAQAAGLSPWHFARALREATGFSPVRYLQQCRVQRATALLANTELTIAEVALAVGFRSQEHFARVFRRLTGTTPASYRRTIRF